MMEVSPSPRPSTSDPLQRAAKLAQLREAEETKRKLRSAKLGVIIQTSDALQLPAGQGLFSTSSSPVRNIDIQPNHSLPGAVTEREEIPVQFIQPKLDQLRSARPLSRAASPASPVKIVAVYSATPQIPDTPPVVSINADHLNKTAVAAWEDQPIAPSKEDLAPQTPPATAFIGYTDISNMNAEQLESWIQRPVPLGVRVMSRIIRKKTGLDALHPQYECHIQHDGIDAQFAMSARRRKKTKVSNYIITATKISKFTGKADIIGKVKANFMGTCFNIYDDGQSPFKKDSQEEDEKSGGSELRKELGTIIYDTNVFGLKGPRKMTIVLPRVMEAQQNEFQPSEERDTIQERYRYNPQDPKLSSLRNKAPHWNETSQSYVLNFHGRVSVASVKNFQVEEVVDTKASTEQALKETESRVILQFGRTGDDTFTLDFEHPMTPLQAFAVALTSFDAKLACE